jgi:hypothetical protein
MRTKFLVLIILAVAGCKKPPNYMSREELLDPEACADCHPDHYREWSGSMHAYSSDDPVFVALNERAQRETGGALGDLCVSCHAPMAVKEGLTTDGLNLDQIPQAYKGVTCYFCHLVESVDQIHNVGQVLANDNVTRSGIRDPVSTTAHRSAYSPLHDRNNLVSSTMCGACHDIRLPNGLHLERTYEEWAGTIFAQDIPARQSCGHCHMRGREGKAADTRNAPVRRVHDHAMAAVDVALTPWPEMERQLELVQDDLDDTLTARLCVNPAAGGVDAIVRLENVAAGHDWPSGATHNRRGWVEIVAYEGETITFQSGVVADGEPVALMGDPLLWPFRDILYKDDGTESHFTWEAADLDTELLSATVTLDPNDPRYYHYKERTYPIVGVPDRITLRVRLRPSALEVLDDLIDSGDLDPAIRDRVPTFDLASTVLEWTGPVGDCVQ